MQWFYEFFKRLKQQGGDLEREIADRVSGYILAAFGLVAGLAWNDAIKGLIEYVYPLKSDGISAKFIYASIMTLIVVILTLYIVRLAKRSDSFK